MVQKASPRAKPVGRPPRFDPDAVIASAVYAFWCNGFANTTLDELESATGVDRSTLYNSFGGKLGLYRSATAAYVAAAEERLFEPLFHGTAGVADILEFIDRLAANFCSTENPCGCLIVNDMAVPADPKTTAHYLERLEGGIEAALQRASAAGEIDKRRAADQRGFLTAAVVGVSLINRNASNNVAGDSLLQGIRAEVATWVEQRA